MNLEKKRFINRALNQVDDVVSSAFNRARYIASTGCCASRNAMENDGADAVRLLSDFLENVEALQEFLAQKSERLAEMIDEIKNADTEAEA